MIDAYAGEVEVRVSESGRVVVYVVNTGAWASGRGPCIGFCSPVSTYILIRTRLEF